MKDLRNYKQRGSPDCPIDAYSRTGGPRHPAYAHWHPELEIMFVEKGSTVLQLDQQTLNLQTNDILIVPPNTIHGQQAYTTEILMRFIVINPEGITMPPTHIFQKEFVEPLQQGRLVMPTVLRPGDPAHAALFPLMQQLKTCIIYRDNYKQNRFSVAMAICTALVPFCRITDTSAPTPDKKHRAVQECIRYIQCNYSQRLTLATLAEQVQLQPNYLCALFKEHMGQTVVEYITGVRVDAAANLLRSTELPINQVAEQCGFRSECLLYKYFKAAMGMTPTAYRRSLTTRCTPDCTHVP